MHVRELIGVLGRRNADLRPLAVHLFADNKEVVILTSDVVEEGYFSFVLFVV
jgi:hypothetical protein